MQYVKYTDKPIFMAGFLNMLFFPPSEHLLQNFLVQLYKTVQKEDLFQN